MRGGRWAAILVAVAMVFATLAATPAMAQNDPIGGLFRALFGVPQRPQAPPPIDPLALPKKRVEPRIVEVPKNPDAQVVLVIGDIEAQGLGYGLQMAFAEDPSIVIVPKVRPNSGLTREGDNDWSTYAVKVLAETRADFVVAMLGVNDFQAFTVPGTRSWEPAGDDWNRMYAERLDRLIGHIRATGKPFWWVGLPPTADADLGPTRRAAYSAFLSSLNDLARPRVGAAGGTFVDVWSAFTDEEGRYTQMGPDIDGQVKRLRTNDGILFTRPGQRKLAFFVEAGIVRLKRGDAPDYAAQPEEKAVEPHPERAVTGAPPALSPPPWAAIGPILPLDGTAPGPDEPLAGGLDRPTPVYMPGGYPVAAAPAHRRLVEGLPLDPPTGRVDAQVRRAP